VFDVLFEASGNQAALRSALDLVRPAAIIVGSTVTNRTDAYNQSALRYE
jgi:threonine dehydrogenase-like Zn-dependent dehydrogenase